MKLRNLLMTAIFLLAVGSSFVINARGKRAPQYSIAIGTPTNPSCWLVSTSTSCETYYTGPQCTVNWMGDLKPIYERPIPSGPSCVTPLRQP